MESDDGYREHLREVERAAAAPYVTVLQHPWWAVPAFGALASLYVLGVELSSRPEVSRILATSLMALLAGSTWVYAYWQRRRSGVSPSGKAPREIDRVMWCYVAGAVVVAIVLILLADLAPLWIGMPAAFILAATGILWFGRAYARAAARVRERLA